MSLLTSEWVPYKTENYFRKLEIYPEMFWSNEIDISTSVVIAAPYGGPIIVVRDRTKLVSIKTVGKPVITVYTSSGKIISSFMDNNGGHLVNLGWSNNEEILCCQENGLVSIYDLFGNYQHTFSMIKDRQNIKIIDARISSNSLRTTVAVLTEYYSIYVMNDITKVKTHILPEIPDLNYPPNLWEIILQDRQTSVLVASENSIFTVSHAECKQQFIKFSEVDFNKDIIVQNSIKKVAVSFDHKNIALLNNDNKIWIGSSDFRKVFRIYNKSFSSTTIDQIAWCGLEGVALYSKAEDVVMIIGKNDDQVSFIYVDPINLYAEIDCVRVIGAFSNDILQLVPHHVQEIFRINSTSPSSYLVEASKQFQKRNHRANEYIHLVSNMLETAVNNCIEAASYEMDVSTQKVLIKAAQFGKTFLQNWNPERYLYMCRLLRVLNAVREPKIGISITYPQLQQISLELLFDKLVGQRHYYLALQASSFIRMSTNIGSSRILTNWAKFKISQTQIDKEQLAVTIADKLGKFSGVYYHNIAEMAANCGRIQLAIKLLDYEPRVNLQVPLLLKYQQDNIALKKAIESGNTDLVYMVLLHMQTTMPLGKFQMEIKKSTVAQALYIKYCHQYSGYSLLDMYTQEDNHEQLALYHIIATIKSTVSIRSMYN
ncbi:vacuolar protein sorting-associated protein 16 homolog isoform X2 [Daktulosphaira vitifoliae]|uniref:vacuolar protein sorting-associated protein 16 homolog isoform X2 n=1 Tax=Daktulosphaira vitifoliae TaxID=58002 RepID=UPI0021AA3976|nr:vacuolar protein sorting-associated protein 16 homolog isoform X2 [Daktulosphaira vitifoliae]